MSLLEDRVWKGAIKPYFRAVRFKALAGYARRLGERAEPYGNGEVPPPPPGFLIGSGRSGTTILGKLFFQHPQVRYLFEPWHLWGEVDPRTDVTNLYRRIDDPLFFMDASHYTPEKKLIFDRLIATPRTGLMAAMGDAESTIPAIAKAALQYLAGKRARAGDLGLRVLEKTPHDVLRLSFVDKLAPGAKYLHVIRSGVDVARSMGRIATVSSYKIAGNRAYNQWWGVDNLKWKALREGGAAGGYFPDEIDALEQETQKGAYEWVVSVAEANRWRERLFGDRMIENRYPDLTNDPATCLRKICAHFEIDAPQSWLDNVCPMVDPERKNKGETLRLPPQMCAQFNAFQERYDFAERAEPL